MSDLNVTAQVSFQKNGTVYPIGGNIEYDITGDKAIKKNENVSSAGTLNLGAVGAIGLVAFSNISVPAVPVAPAPVITQGGTPGVVGYTYVVVALFADGSVSVGIASTATGAATLNATNYNIITWASVGAASYNVYRTVSGGTPSTIGKIATGATSPRNDQGAAGDGSATPQTTLSYFPVRFGPDGISYPIEVGAGNTAVIPQWNAAAIYRQPVGLAAEIEYLVVEK
jgi:hypothetical protein